MQEFEQKIFHSITEEDFSSLAITLFNYQFFQNAVYQEYCKHLHVFPDKIKAIEEIPFLPVSFFKTHQVISSSFVPEAIFSSSGTSGMQNARHYVKSLSLYEKSFWESFRYFYGNPEQYTFLALLPGYLEREGSSLIYMMEKMISRSTSPQSGFYLYDHQKLYETLLSLKSSGKKTVLFGVSFALLDFAEQYNIEFSDLIIFETGGMKGRRREIVKEELHHILKTAFGVKAIHSEYGMCELLSQAYSQGNNVFETPPWMKLILRDEKNPLLTSEQFTSGAVNVIDLANIYSCAFIATEDLGKKTTNGIEIIGRLDNSEIRGCNLLVF